ncbi:MAG: hypothetical protein HKUEN01_33510 [Candidatus Kuenenia stuttgartiensis]|nr:MAG: hypothetical protein HKUEN01_33510 [Candidatus Kuenenia stuttgartiensis]
MTGTIGILKKANMPHKNAEKGSPIHKLNIIVSDMFFSGNKRREISSPKGNVIITIKSKEILLE